jgi:hypothetical protein
MAEREMSDILPDIHEDRGAGAEEGADPTTMSNRPPETPDAFHLSAQECENEALHQTAGGLSHDNSEEYGHCTIEHLVTNPPEHAFRKTASSDPRLPALQFWIIGLKSQIRQLKASRNRIKLQLARATRRVYHQGRGLAKLKWPAAADKPIAPKPASGANPGDSPPRDGPPSLQEAILSEMITQ